VNSTAKTFNLQVVKMNGTQVQVLESYTNLSIVATSAQYAVTVINSDSSYITFNLAFRRYTYIHYSAKLQLQLL